MRLLADLIRGEKVDKALAILEHNSKHPAIPMRKLVLSAINNWKQKNEGGDEGELVVKTIMVDGGRTLKRMRPAPQGRGYRVRKRSNHVIVVVDIKGIKTIKAAAVEDKEVDEKAEVKETMPKTKAPAAKKKTTGTKKTK